MKYVVLFVAIQLASLLLAIIGVPIILVLAYGGFYAKGSDGKLHFPRAFWIYDNEEDGVAANWYQATRPGRSLSTDVFLWSAWRNTVNNLRFVPGVSKVGRPLFLKYWYPFGHQLYVKAGWLTDGYPSMSFGRGRGW